MNNSFIVWLQGGHTFQLFWGDLNTQAENIHYKDSNLNYFIFFLVMITWWLNLISWFLFELLNFPRISPGMDELSTDIINFVRITHLSGFNFTDCTPSLVTYLNSRGIYTFWGTTSYPYGTSLLLFVGNSLWFIKYSQYVSGKNVYSHRLTQL